MPPAESRHHLELVAPHWDAEDALHRALAAIDQARAAAKYPAVDDYATATVGDYLRARRDGFHCRLGDVTHLSHADKGVSSVNRNLCKRADCLNCTPYWLKVQLRRAFANWDGAPLYRAVFASYDEVRTSARGQALTRAHPGRYLRLTIGYAGEQWIFFPGAPGDGDPVLDSATEILDALLRVPAYANGKRRVQLPKKVAAMRRPLDDEPEHERPEGYVQVQLPHFVTADDAERVFPGHGLEPNGANQISGVTLANQITAAIIGREVAQTIPYRRGQHYASWTVTGLTRDQVYEVRAAIQPLSEIFYAERTARRARRAAARAAPTWWRG